MKITAAGHQDTMPAAIGIIIAVMLCFMIIAVGLDSINSLIQCSLQAFLPLIEVQPWVCQYGNPPGIVNALHGVLQGWIFHTDIAGLSGTAHIPVEIHRLRLTTSASGLIIRKLFFILILLHDMVHNCRKRIFTCISL